MIEVVVGKEAVAARFEQLIHRAQEEMLVLDRPPYARAVADANEPERAALSRGVVIRGIYAPEAFEVHGVLEHALVAGRDGEMSRIHADVPMKLAVVDSATALMPIADGDVESSLVVYSPGVVAALVRLFDLLWRHAHPIGDWQDGTTTDDGVDRALLLLLSTGIKDEVIARQLGISVRTLSRRVARLLQFLGARTRFQAGLRAHRSLPQLRDLS